VRRHPDAVTLDGVRLNVRRGWMLFRASRTEKAIRISVEGDNRKQAEGLLEEAKAMLEDVLRQGM
jgi:phosphomannomutase